MTLDPDWNTESRLVMFFEDGIASEPTTLSNDGSGSGVWLKNDTWLETDWDYLSSYLFTEGEQFNGPSQPSQEVHFLITKAFADDGNNENEDPGNNGNGGGNAGGVDENAESVPAGSESNDDSSTVAETGDDAGVAFLIISVLASAGVIAVCARIRTRAL